MSGRGDVLRVLAMSLGALGASSGTASADQTRPVIAVFGVQDPSGRFSATELEQLTTYFAAELARGEVFKVVPQSQLKSALSSLKEGSYSACYDEECQIEIGREVAAEKSVMTQILVVGSKCAVTSTLWDLRSSASERATRVKVDCDPDSLVGALEQSAIELKSKPQANTPSLARPEPSRAAPESVRPAERSASSPALQTEVPSPKDRPGPSLALPLVVTGAGVAAAVVGAVFLVKASGHASNAEDPSFVGGQVEIERAELSQTVGFVSLSAGLALTTLGTVLLVVELAQDDSPTVGISPTFSGHGGGLALFGSF